MQGEATTWSSGAWKKERQHGRTETLAAMASWYSRVAGAASTITSEKAILDWLVDDLAADPEIDEFIVVTNHKFAEHFVRWGETKAQKITVVDDGTSTNETRLGAVKDIQFALEQAGVDDDVFVMAGDNVLDFSLCRFIEFAKARGDVVRDVPRGAGAEEAAEDGDYYDRTGPRRAHDGWSGGG